MDNEPAGASPVERPVGRPAPERDEELCADCEGSGTVRAMTSHLGPDDYEYDEQCPACAGCGSANLKDAIESLPYSLHRVRGCHVIERAAVLRIVEAHMARLKTPNHPISGGTSTASQS